jgi:serine/threonine protein kinase
LASKCSKKICYKYQPSWEIGLLLYEILFGQLPFSTRDFSGTIIKVVTARETALEHNFEYPQKILQLIDKCLEIRNPQDRPLPPEICKTLSEIINQRETSRTHRLVDLYPNARQNVESERTLGKSCLEQDFVPIKEPLSERLLEEGDFATPMPYCDTDLADGFSDLDDLCNTKYF